MFNKILVPLDGSKLAECAIEYAEELAKSCRASELVLVSVTERVIGKTRAPEAKELYRSSGLDMISGGTAGTSGVLSHNISPPGPREMFGASSGEDRIIDGDQATTVILGKKEKQAWNYLNRIAKKIKKKGIPVKIEVLIGNPAEKISSYAEEENFDTIVIASHGRSGPSRWAMGSVSDKVFRASCIPVLLVRAPGCFPGV